VRDVSFLDQGGSVSVLRRMDKESPRNRSCMESRSEAEWYMKSHCEEKGYIRGCSGNERFVRIYFDTGKSL
jgi:hypothetical protein